MAVVFTVAGTKRVFLEISWKTLVALHTNSGNVEVSRAVDATGFAVLLMKLKWNCVINHGNNHGALWYQCVNSACSVLLLLVRKIEVYHTRPVCVNFVLVLLELNGPCTKDLNKQQRIAFCKLLISSSVCSVQSLTVLLSSRLRSWS